MVVSAPMPWKASSPIDWTLDGISRSLMATHDENAWAPMLVTVEGSTATTASLQSSIDAVEMVSSSESLSLDTVKFVKLEELANALSPIEVIPSGNTTLCIDEPSKDPSPIALTSYETVTSELSSVSTSSLSAD